MRLALGAAVAAHVLAARLPAQVVVHVESRGFPVSNVEVGAWSASQRVAAARTDISGNARLPLDASARTGATLLVRRLGYAPVRLVLGRGDSVRVELEAVAASLPVLAVTLRQIRCPAPMDPVAESLWTAAAARVHSGAQNLHFSWRGTVSSETVPTEQRGYGDDWGRIRYSYGAYHPGDGRQPDNLLTDPPPYAKWEKRITGRSEEWRWRYAGLEGNAAAHFASPRFLQSHTLQVLGHNGDATVLGFCPRGNEPTSIEGELQLSDDGELRAARWSFRVDHDDEDAGGEATFASAELDGARYLFALRGATWQRAREGLYNQERFERIAWRFGRTLESIEIPPAH
jgi:hypothetical protein